MKNLLKISVLLFLLASLAIKAAEPIKIIYPDYETLRPKIALVLSGGGARGMAQIGAIEELDLARVPIDYIVGTSIGSIIGGLLASGYSAFQLDSIVNEIEWNKIFSIASQNKRTDLFLDQKVIEDRSLLTLRFKNFKFVVPEAISTGDDFNMTLQNIFWNSLYKPGGDFNNLKYKYRAVSTDLISGQSISQRYGSLISAVRASATIPLRYTPVRINSMILIDGGIFANVPCSQALEFNPDMIIAINTVSPLLETFELNTPWNIADQVISISMDKFTAEQLSLADFVITPQISRHRNTDFRAIDTLISKGRYAAELMINDIVNKYHADFDSLLLGKINSKITNEHFSNKSIVLQNFYVADSLFLYNKLQNNGNIRQYNEAMRNIIRSDKYKKIEALFDEDNISLKAYKYNTLNNILLIGCENYLIKEYVNLINQSVENIYLNPKGKRNVIERVLNKYRNNGYSYATVTYQREDDYGNLFLTIDEGIIHEIRIIGNEQTSNFLIQRELKFKPGEPLNTVKIVKGWNNLKKTELFSSVDIYIEEDPTSQANILYVKVVEGGTQTIRLGGRVDNERYTQIGIDVIQDNLLNAGIRATARMAFGSRNEDYSLLLDNPRISKSQYSFNSSVYYSFRNIKHYSFKKNTATNRFARRTSNENAIERIGGKMAIGKQIDKNGIFGIEYRLEKQRNYNTDSAKTDYQNISTLKLSTKFDSEDRIDFPKSGQYIELSLETGVLSIQPATNFSKAFFYMHQNYQIGDIIAKPSMLFGVADKTLPYSEFFSLGGEGSFLGYREDEERGRQIFRGSLELRSKLPFQIFFDTYLSLRYDLGSTWDKPESIRFNNLKHGTGASLQIDSPLGPAKFTVGRALYFISNPNTVVLGETLVYFSIGMRL